MSEPRYTVDSFLNVIVSNCPADGCGGSGDSFGVSATEHWDALLDLQKEWQDFIELQLVALVPLGYWSTPNGHLFAKKVATSGGLLGGVLVPPFNKKQITSNTKRRN